MTSQPTPRFTLPDPNRDPMTPLPAELLARVLRCAQEGQTLEEQLETRLNFEKVCKAWFECDFRWKVVVLTGFEAVESFVSSLISMKAAQAVASTAAEQPASAEDVGSRVKALRLELRAGDEIDKSKVILLLSMLGRVRTLELVVHSDALSGRDDCLSFRVSQALANLVDIEHFRLSGLEEVYFRVMPVLSSTLATFLPSWPKLKSLAFHGCLISKDTCTKEIFKNCAQLESLELDQCEDDGDEGAPLWAELPPSACELKVNFFAGSGWPGQRRELDKNALALGVTRQLVSVSLTASRGVIRPSRDWPRGFVVNLDNVTDLTISPGAITSLTTLADLESLSDLTLVLADDEDTIDADELVWLLENSHSLKRVAISPAFYLHWTKRDRQALKRAAEPNIMINWTNFAD